MPKPKTKPKPTTPLFARIDSALYKKMKILCVKREISLTKALAEAIQEYLDREDD
jgi:hypothetical protein